MSGQDAAERVFRRQVDAFNSHDLEAFLACYADDAVVLSSRGAPILGGEALRAAYVHRFDDAALRCDIESVEHLADGWLRAHEIVTSSAGEVRVFALFQIVGDVIRRAGLFPADEPGMIAP